MTPPSSTGASDGEKSGVVFEVDQANVENLLKTVCTFIDLQSHSRARSHVHFTLAFGSGGSLTCPSVFGAIPLVGSDPKPAGLYVGGQQQTHWIFFCMSVVHNRRMVTTFALNPLIFHSRNQLLYTAAARVTALSANHNRC